MRYLAFAALATLTLPGCGVSVTPENAADRSIPELCRAVHWANLAIGTSSKGPAMAELAARSGFSQRELAAIASGEPFIGMSEASMRCLYADRFEAVNVSEGAWGVRKQFVYGSSLALREYIYTRNGAVTGHQH